MFSFSDDLGAKPAGGSPRWYRRDHRVQHRGIPEGDQLLGLQRHHAPAEQEVRHQDEREQLQDLHEAHGEEPDEQGLRQLQVHIEKFPRRNRGIDQTLR